MRSKDIVRVSCVVLVVLLGWPLASRAQPSGLEISDVEPTVLFLSGSPMRQVALVKLLNTGGTPLVCTFHAEMGGEVVDLPGLDQCSHLKQLIESTKPARHHDKSVTILNQHHLADKEVVEVNPGIEIGVWLLFPRQLDIAPDGPSPCFPGTAIGGLHHPRPAARHDRKP